MSDEIPELSDFGRDVLIAGFKQFEQFIGFLDSCRMVKELMPANEQAAVLKKLIELPAIRYWFN
jgi:hypothetical protein